MPTPQNFGDLIATPIDILDREYIRPYPIRPAIMNAVFLNLLKHYFAHPAYLKTPRFKLNPNKTLEPDENSSVFIASASAFTPEITDKRPAVIIRRMEWSCNDIGVGENTMPVANSTQRRFLYSFSGSHAFFCTSRESGELDLLTEEVMNCFIYFRPVIRRILGLAKFLLKMVDKVTIFRSNRDYFVCPIMVQYLWTESWTTEPNFDEVMNIIENAALDKGWPPISQGD